jgi:hypothetical protein
MYRVTSALLNYDEDKLDSAREGPVSICANLSISFSACTEAFVAEKKSAAMAERGMRELSL